MKTNSKKTIFFITILGTGITLIGVLLSTVNEHQSNKVSFSPVFQIAGKIPQSINRSATKTLPIDSVDEGELGDIIRSAYSGTVYSEEDQKTQSYLRGMLKNLEPYKKKPFPYDIYLVDSPYPNAMALPGGIILVTKGLFSVLKDESELMAVLAHEMGHVELSHCMDSAKYEILTRKLANTTIGEWADTIVGFMIKHSFSKNQEDEADQYSFAVMTLSKYDPRGVGNAFSSLLESEGVGKAEGPNPFRDYLESHPPLSQRAEKFDEMAKLWWSQNQNAKRYVGIQNLKERKFFPQTDFGPSEWK